MVFSQLQAGIFLLFITGFTLGQYERDGKKYDDPAFAHDSDHISSHLKEDYGVEVSTENMTETELEWHYFNLHDTDDNYMLDGLEMYKGWQHHYSGHEEKGKTAAEGQKAFEDMNNIFVGIVDEVLERQDLDKDGYVDWFEFAQAKEHQKEEESKSKS